MSKIARLVGLIEKYPGLNAISLRRKGWRWQTHGSLVAAEKAGILEYKDSGWYVSEEIIDRAKDHAHMMGYMDASDVEAGKL